MFRRLILGFGILVFGFAAHAVELNEEKYDIYYGDFDGDGVDGDIYVHQKDTFVLIHSDISIPLLINGEESFVWFSNGDGSTMPFDIPEDELGNYALAVEGINYFYGNFNGDAQLDLKVFKLDGSGETVSFFGSGDSALPSTSSSNIVSANIPTSFHSKFQFVNTTRL